ACRKHRFTVPVLEDLEGRVVLSQVVPLNPGAVGTSLSGSPHDGLVPYPLASGGIGWLYMPGASGVLANEPSGAIADAPFDLGVIMGSLPVASPFASGAFQGSVGPAGYTPIQIQTAYGLSTGGGYNTGISFAGIKGDGTGQTI